jgi:methylenetetrahydrofolate dehydrogenase (NADP+)/methenyltetrahydrofolate cyclohydrolase
MPPANLIDGRAIASQILGEAAQRIKALKTRGIKPGLAFVRVGEIPRHAFTWA